MGKWINKKKIYSRETYHYSVYVWADKSVCTCIGKVPEDSTQTKEWEC